MDQNTINKIKQGIYKNLSYTNQDFESIMVQMLDIVQDPEFPSRWNNLTESDPITMLLAIVAAHTDILNYMVDYRILETYMSTARERQSMIRIANSFGYKVPGYTASRILYKVESGQTGSLGVIQPFTTIEDSNGVMWTYTGPEKGIYAGGTVEFFEGYAQTEEFNGTEVPLSNEKIIQGNNVAFNNAYNNNPVASLVYGQDGTKFEFVDRLYTKISTPNVFDFGEDVIGMTYIKFLNTLDIHNDYPNKFTLNYIVTSGGDINISPAKAELTTSSHELSLVPEGGSFYRGSSGTPTDKIKQGFKDYYAGMDTLVTVKDYANYIKNVQRVVPEIDKVFVLDSQTDSNGGQGHPDIPAQTVAIYATKKDSLGQSDPIDNVFKITDSNNIGYEYSSSTISFEPTVAGEKLVVLNSEQLAHYTLLQDVSSVKLVNSSDGIALYHIDNGSELYVGLFQSLLITLYTFPPTGKVKIAENSSSIPDSSLFRITFGVSDLRDFREDILKRKVTGISVQINNTGDMYNYYPITGKTVTVYIKGTLSEDKPVKKAIEEYLLSKNIGDLLTIRDIQQTLAEQDLLKYFVDSSNMSFDDEYQRDSIQLGFNEYVKTAQVDY